MDNLRKMYIDENKTAREISVILGKSLSYVVNKLSSNNIRKGITTEWFNISLTRKFETFSIIKDKSINRKRKIVPTSKITNAIYIS